MLTVEGLDVSRAGALVVHGVELEVASAEAVALIGANGAGKSTVLETVCGLLPAASGDVRVDGVSVLGHPVERIARAGVAFVPSRRNLFAGMTVQVNLELGAYPRRPDPGRIAFALELFPRIAERRRQLAGTLSGGEQQMLAVARALVAAPRLLVLDEPSTGLAPLLADETYAALGTLRSELATAVLVAEQQVVRVLSFADRGYLLEGGRVVLSGAADELARSPEVERAYLGRT